MKTALLSVHNKDGLVDFGRGLHDRGVRLLSTGGTATRLEEAGLPVTRISEYTGQAEMLEGRVKTLHPKIFAGILARREDSSQMEEIDAAGAEPIDLVAVNLYPFEATVARQDHTLIEALEQIDIGGVTLLRAAAKNAPGVIVAVDPSDYGSILEELDRGGMELGRRLQLAHRAIAHTNGYDAAISGYLSSLEGTPDLDSTPRRARFPEHLGLTFTRLQGLRYGENPHQEAAFYSSGRPPRGLAAAEQLHGKELSFNNILDLDAAWRLALDLSMPGAAVIKHGNPAGAASATEIVEAYREARATDPLSAFGGVVGLNEPCDGAVAAEISETFIEAVIAPGYTDDALETLRSRKNLRVMRAPHPDADERPLDLRWVAGGLLVQDRDPGGAERWECVTERQPSEEEERGLRFAWTVISHVRSNAILLARETRLIGVGAGQMSRVDSSKIAVRKAGEGSHEIHGAVAASDAFFPFADGVEALAEAGITAIVQPGGSIRDDEVVEAADRLGLAMVFTGTRHFLH